jgi:hypothetical protein
MAISIVVEHRVGDRPHSHREHVVRPDAEAEERDEDSGIDHDRISENRLARECGQDLGHQPKRRENQDVDLRMSEDPEQVLPEQGIGAGGERVEVGTEEPIELEEHERDRDHRERQHEQELHDERHPCEHRHAHQVHSRRAHVDDRRDEIERRRERRDTEDLKAEHPEVDVHPRRVRQGRQRSVAEPSAVRRHPDEPRRVHEE